MNRVKLEGKWEDIDCESDFWKQCKAAIIPDVTDCIQVKTKELVVEKEKFQVVANSFGLSFDENAEISLNEEDKKALQSEGMSKYSDKMTEIRHLKKEIELHTSIARCVVENIKTREIDLLFSYEDNVMSNIPVEPTAFETFVQRITNETDLLRLFYIYVLNSSDASAFQKIIEQKNISLKAMEYIKKFVIFM